MCMCMCVSGVEIVKCVGVCWNGFIIFFIKAALFTHLKIFLKLGPEKVRSMRPSPCYGHDDRGGTMRPSVPTN